MSAELNDPNIFRGAESRELTPQEKQTVRAFKLKAMEFTTFIDTQVSRNDNAREIRKVKEHIEDAVMWATKYLTKEQNGYGHSQR